MSSPSGPKYPSVSGRRIDCMPSSDPGATPRASTCHAPPSSVQIPSLPRAGSNAPSALARRLS
jgi:hypothetical protein